MVKSKLGIFSRLLKSARLAVVQEPPSDIFVGQDKLGNKYFEIPDKNGERFKGKTRRRVEPFEPVDLTKICSPTVPVEWLTWLQGRREHAPTSQELNANELYKRTIQQRVMKSEGIAEVSEGSAEMDDDGRPVRKQTTSKSTTSFPVYDDYTELMKKADEKTWHSLSKK